MTRVQRLEEWQNMPSFAPWRVGGSSCEIFNRIVSIRKYIFFIFTIKKRDSVTLSHIKPVVHFYVGISTKRNLSDETAKPVR